MFPVARQVAEVVGHFIPVVSFVVIGATLSGQSDTCSQGHKWYTGPYGFQAGAIKKHIWARMKICTAMLQVTLTRA